MGKRRDLKIEDNLSEEVHRHTPKRHKKHKKHKKKKVCYDSDAVDVVTEVPPIKIKKESSSVSIMDFDDDLEEEEQQMSAAEKLKSESQNQEVVKIINPIPAAATVTVALNSATKSQQKKKKNKSKESGTSSEEERWLDAIESGKLEEVDDELKKIKDPKLMTARQRAMYERGMDKEPGPGCELLMALPSGYKEKVMTAEAIQKAQLKSQKRKQLADEKREKDKKKTMERLLKKQDSKCGKNSKNRPIKTQVPRISYKNTLDGATITLPPNYEFPLKPQIATDPPKPIVCAMPNCTNIKKYSCSKTNLPLCSFRCYKENVASLKQIIC